MEVLMHRGVSPQPALPFAAFALACLFFPSCGDREDITAAAPASPSPSPSSSTGSGSSPSNGAGGAAAGQGGSEDGGAGDAGSAGDAGGAGGGQVDPDDVCRSLSAPSEPAARVVWLREHKIEIHLQQEVALDWAFPYAVKVPEGEASLYAVELERCMKLAGEAETCETGTLSRPSDGCSLLMGPRFGVDPNLYNEGDNTYAFTLRLIREDLVESWDRFAIHVHYDPR
jgi:hypothetical protein